MTDFLVSVKLPPADHALTAAAARALSTSEDNIAAVKILKRSVDARRTPVLVYSLAVSLRQSAGITAPIYKPSVPFTVPKSSASFRPVVVGLGPAGLFGALILARAGLRPIVLERGADIDKRRAAIDRFIKTGVLDPDTNVQFGEGGAGAFSDGKLSTGTKSPLLSFVRDTFILHGAPPEIAYDAQPHIGSDRLPAVVRGIREEICRLGGEIRFLSPLTDIKITSRGISAVEAAGSILETEALLLCVGHSARDTFSMLYEKGVSMEAKPFAVGARIEHRRTDIDRALYHDAAALLPAASYRLVVHPEGTAPVYTFCMCPGGYVIPAASEDGGVVTNGYSLYARDGENSNSALLVGVTPADFGSGALDGVRFQREIEQKAFRAAGAFRAPCQRAADFLAGRRSAGYGHILPTYARGTVPGSIEDCLPDFVTDALRAGLPLLRGKLAPFGDGDALLTAPETRSSSPVRILRDENGESSIAGLFPAGEGSGYAGGIMSAAVDGIRAALCIIQKNGQTV